MNTLCLYLAVSVLCHGIPASSLSSVYRFSGWTSFIKPNSRAWLWMEADPAKRRSMPEDGFVELMYSAPTNRLLIQSMQRPLRWPANDSFCTPVLQAAIRQMATLHSIPVETLTSMSVEIDSLQYQRACKCYVRAMAGMGFTHADRLNGDPLELIPRDEDGVDRFCKERPRWNVVASVQGDRHPHLPPADPLADERLATADVVIDTFD